MSAFQKLVKISLFAYLLFAVSGVNARTEIHYFYPDSPVSNLSQLKVDMEELFSMSPFQVRFQPFARLSDFDQQLKFRNATILFTPEWYISNKNSLQIVMQAMRGGKSTYQKLLISSNTRKLSEISFKGKSLAMTAMGSEFVSTKNLFNKKNNIQLHELNTIEVTKDIDAIFAVALKQVDYALVAETSVDKVNKINPKIISSIQVLAKTTPLSLPSAIHVIGKLTEKELKEFIDFMKSLTHQQDNPFKNLLLIDEWQEVK